MGWLKTFLENRRFRRAAKHAKQNSAKAEREDQRAAAAALLPTGRHAAVAIADPFAFEASHKRLAWMFRLSAGGNIAQLFAIVVLVNVIAGMVPLKEKIPLLIRPVTDDQLRFRIEPATEDVKGFDVELEGTARRYVKMLLEIDAVSQEARQREVSKMSERKLWNTFHSEWIESGKISDAIKEGRDREIKIESANRIYSSDNKYRFAVDFTRIDKIKGKRVGDPVKLRAYLSMVSVPTVVSLEDKYTNPFGIVVTDLSLRSRGGS